MKVGTRGLRSRATSPATAPGPNDRKRCRRPRLCIARVAIAYRSPQARAAVFTAICHCSNHLCRRAQAGQRMLAARFRATSLHPGCRRRGRREPAPGLNDWDAAGNSAGTQTAQHRCRYIPRAGAFGVLPASRARGQATSYSPAMSIFMGRPMAMTATESSRVLRDRRARRKVMLTVVLGRGRTHRDRPSRLRRAICSSAHQAQIVRVVRQEVEKGFLP